MFLSYRNMRKTNNEQLSEGSNPQTNNRWPTSAESLSTQSSSPTGQHSLLDKSLNEVETASPGLKPFARWHQGTLDINNKN